METFIVQYLPGSIGALVCASERVLWGGSSYPDAFLLFLWLWVTSAHRLLVWGQLSYCMHAQAQPGGTVLMRNPKDVFVLFDTHSGHMEER